MKKIAMFNCLRANEVCTGAACMKAFNRREKSFARYVGEDMELAAFARCNGCDHFPESDRGMEEKLDRFVREGIETVHMGVCTRNREGQECSIITEIIGMIEKRGIEVVRGTH